MNNYFPKYISSKAIPAFLFVLLAVTVIFMQKMLPPLWMFSAIAEVIFFFYFSNDISKRWASVSEKTFRKKLFTGSLWIRLVYVVFSYFFYTAMTGIPFEFSAADSYGYHQSGIWFKDLIQGGYFKWFFGYVAENISDSGYPFYLSIIYFFTGSSILAVRLIKAFIGAGTAMLVYKFAKRNFGEDTARVAGIMFMLFPNLIMYCGLHLKETEMIFLLMFFIERADYLIRGGHYNFKIIFVVILTGLSLFFFRTVFGVIAFSSLLAAILFTSKGVFKFNRKLALSLWIILISVLLGATPLKDEIYKYWEGRTTNLERSLEARSQQERGNSFAEYAGASVFLPFMPVVPFPTLINVPWQQNHMFFAGGFFVKNVLGFFAIMGFILLKKRKEIMNNAFILFFTGSYLIILAFSRFALVERFHLPLVPIMIILGAYGITNSNLNKKYFLPFMVLLFFAIIMWNWIKIAGRV